MTLELNDQEHQYLMQVLVRQPIIEALPLYLKLTGQVIVNEPPRASAPLSVVQP